MNPVEQNNPSKKAVLEQIAASNYAYLWLVVWGEPISTYTAEDVEMNYDRIGQTIAAYEASTEVNQFSSKYDAYLAGATMLTAQEAWGLELFEGKAMCSACHISEPGPDGEPPLFTDFTYDNLGVPKNPDNPFYDMDKVYLDDGTPINPLGADWIDHGLGDFLRSLADPSNQGWRNLPYVTNVKSINNKRLLAYASANDGKHKVPTLRNVGKRTGEGFPKAYMHNGVFKSLEEVVHFYNTRDVKPSCESLAIYDATEEMALANDCWHEPEVADNVNTDELGDLGLTAAEEAALVAFLKTLSDGYIPQKQ